MAYKYHADKLKIAQSLGFRSIDAAINHLYAKHQSCRKVGEIFGMTGAAINYQLKRIGIPRRGRGGYNR